MNKAGARILFEEALNPILVVDEEGRYLDANPAALDFLECTRDLLLGKTVWDNTPSGKMAKQQREYSPFQEPRTIETEYEVKGKIKTLLLNIVPGELAGKTVLYGIGLDITERKLAEERELQLKRMLLTIRNVNLLIIQETDPHRLIQRSCQIITETLGYSNAWIALFDELSTVTDTASSGFNGHFENLSSRLATGLLPECVQKVMDQGEMTTVDAPEAECPECPLSKEQAGRSSLVSCLTFAGHLYGVLVVAPGFPITHGSEALELYTELVEDLSFALHKIEQAKTLRLTQEPYRHLLENAGGGVTVTQGERIVFANRKMEDLFGYPEIILFSKPYSEFIHPDDRSFALATAQNALEDEHPPEKILLRAFSADRQIRWIEITGVRIDWDGAPAILNFISDVTQRIKAEEAHRERMKERDCLYAVSRYLHDPDIPSEMACRHILAILPSGRQDLSAVKVAIELDGTLYGQCSSKPAQNVQVSLTASGVPRGKIMVTSSEEASLLPEEQKFIESVAELFGQWMERKETFEKLRDTRRLLQETQAIARLGGWEFDVLTGQVFWTEEMYRIYEVESSQDPNQVYRSMDLYTPDDRMAIEEAFAQSLESGIPFDLEVGLIRHEKEGRWIRIVGKPVLEKGRVVRVTGNTMDITERKKAEERIRYLSFHDYLTDLYNRTFIEEELKRLGESRLLPLGVMLCDVNGLKMVNDAFGHQTGDHLLSGFAQILRQHLRREDLIARWGGDEFIVLLPTTSEEALAEITLRLQQACQNTRVKEIPLNISIGYALKDDPALSIDKVIAQAEENMYRFKLTESQSARSAIITSLEQSLRETTQETQEHAQRMRELVRRVGEALALPASEFNDLDLLARLHDLGKIAIPRHILNKPGPLTPEEWETVKKHPEVGYRIAESSPDLLPIAEAILAHHERWDGTGYPRGQKGEEILLLARIIAAVDAFDVMTEGRPYRRAMTVDEALSELRRCAGSQFDPRIVDVFVEMMGERISGGWK